MKRESFESKSWDDLVFENRNKEYGAYSVRKSYSQHMTTGFGFSVAIVAFLLILPRIVSMLTGGEVILPSLPLLKEPIVEVLSPPSITKPVTPPPSQPPMQRASPFTPRVVDTEPTDTIPTNDELDEMLAQPTGDGPVVDANPGPTVVEAPPAPVDPPFYLNVEEMPEYEGGFQEMSRYIFRKMRYPSSAQRTGTEGTVFVSFIINPEGKVTDVSVVKGISGDCDKEAARVIGSMKDWKPGKQNHRTVPVKMVLPIKFKLQE